MNLSSLGIVSSSIGVYNILRECGFNADIFCGHSLGEFCALHAAGLLTEAQFREIMCHRAKSISDGLKQSSGSDRKKLGKLTL